VSRSGDSARAAPPSSPTHREITRLAIEDLPDPEGLLGQARGSKSRRSSKPTTKPKATKAPRQTQMMILQSLLQDTREQLSNMSQELSDLKASRVSEISHTNLLDGSLNTSASGVESTDTLILDDQHWHRDQEATQRMGQETDYSPTSPLGESSSSTDYHMRARLSEPATNPHRQVGREVRAIAHDDFASIGSSMRRPSLHGSDLSGHSRRVKRVRRQQPVDLDIYVPVHERRSYPPVPTFIGGITRPGVENSSVPSVLRPNLFSLNNPDVFTNRDAGTVSLRTADAPRRSGTEMLRGDLDNIDSTAYGSATTTIISTKADVPAITTWNHD
jgi:hypothetical protein